MIFDFQAIDGDGATLEGDVKATSEEQARRLLRQEFPNLRSITSLKPQPVTAPKVFRVAHGEVVIFYRRLAVLLEAGVTIDRALLFVAESAEGPIVEVVEVLQQGVSRGENLMVAISRPEMAQVFSPLARGLIGTGLKTGALAESLARLADVAERRYSQRRAFISALTYPAVLSVCIALLALLFLLYIAPGELGIYATLGAQLPWPSQVLVNLSNLLRSPILWAALSVIGLVVYPLLRRALRFGTGFRRRVDQRLLRVPFFGSLWEKAVATEVLHIWSSSLRVGVPLGEGIALSLPTVTNTEVLERLKKAHLELREGGDFGEALRQFDVFPQLVTSMISLGFESGQLDGMLERVSQLYEDEVNVALTQMSKVIEPVLLGVAGFMAGFVALACLMPMLQLGSSL